MISVAVCDDEVYHRQKTLEDLAKLCLDEKLQAIDYSSGEDLLSEFRSGNIFDIVLLDVEMPGEDGIEIAEKIRELSADTILIFVSSHQHYMVPSLKVRTFDFLVKPVSFQLLADTLERAVANYHEMHMTYKILYNVTNIVIPVRAIHYLEAQGHCLLVHAQYDEEVRILKCKGTLDTEEEKLLSRGFIRTHRSYLVNPANISEIDRLNILMRCGDTVPISQRSKKKVMEEFRKYLARYGI